MSALFCGCDPEAKHLCAMHRPDDRYKASGVVRTEATPWLDAPVSSIDGSAGTIITSYVVKDSGERKQFTSGSLRDTTTGKINWSRVFPGPMLRRWAQHLTTAEAKYPDVSPGVANWTLIESDEEYHRYKESAFRHFMQWYNDDIDEDHAAACYFNINGVELIKEKRRKGDTK